MRVRAPFLASVAALLACAAPASAATFTVDTTADDGAANCQAGQTACSLRGAVTEANRIAGVDTINLPSGDYVLTQGTLTLTASANLNGASAANTRILAGGTFRTLAIGNNASVSLTHVTVANGTATTVGDPIGGNVRVGAAATLLADHVRVTGGHAGRGGGIGILGGTATISDSLIDNNQAVNVAGANVSGDGGGLMRDDNGGNGRDMRVLDSTIAFNKALSGAGLVVRGSGGNTTTLMRSTVARNDATSQPGGGIFLPDAQTFTSTGSIVANNTGNVGQLASLIAASNCAGAVTSGGSNLESQHDCNFTGAGDGRDIDPQLAASLTDAGGETLTLPIPRTSPALDRIPIGSSACPAANQTDQRGAVRPSGAGCDAGAFELDVEPPSPTIVSGGASGTGASFTFSANEAGSTFECRLDGPAGQGVFAPCASPASFSGLAPGNYLFFVRAIDAAGNVSAAASRAFTIAEPPPVPVVNKTVVITPISGKVLVKLPGRKTFEPVDVTRGIPNLATVDTKHGRIRLTAIPKAGKAAESALFFDGIFQVRLGGGVTELRLNEALAKCPSGNASASAKKPKTRKLWGDGSGSFRTRGQYSAATVRGTRWLVQDSCGKTLTRVSKGVVTVQDFVKHKKVLLRAPHSYTARKKR